MHFPALLMILIIGVSIQGMHASYDDYEADYQSERYNVSRYMSGGGQGRRAPVDRLYPGAKEYQIPGYPAITGDLSVATYSGKTYVLLHQVKANWMKAHNYCRMHGMELLSFYAKDEFDFVKHFVGDLDFVVDTSHGYDIIWLGIHDLFMEGKFTNLYSGRPFTSFFNSPADEPNNHGGVEHCLSIRKGLDQETMWVNDYYCDQPLYFVCTDGVLDYAQNCQISSAC